MNCWKYQGQCLEVPPSGFYGFIYRITDDQGREYFGKKAFSHQKKSKLSKKARAGTRKRIKIQQVDSKWINYWGSCKPLLEYIETRGGTHGFTRSVIKLCENKQSLSYWEMATLVTNNVLFRPDTWNGNVMARFYKGKIHK
jgi:hypothetical protein